LQARAFYGFQIAIENIHSEMYSLMIDAYVKDTQEKDQLFHAVDHFDSVRRKAEWALKWTDRCNPHPPPPASAHLCNTAVAHPLQHMIVVYNRPQMCRPD